jgi:hypothetical protein
MTIDMTLIKNNNFGNGAALISEKKSLISKR